jgi:hypothetical protein
MTDTEIPLATVTATNRVSGVKELTATPHSIHRIPPPKESMNVSGESPLEERILVLPKYAIILE